MTSVVVDLTPTNVVDLSTINDKENSSSSSTSSTSTSSTSSTKSSKRKHRYRKPRPQQSYTEQFSYINWLDPSFYKLEQRNDLTESSKSSKSASTTSCTWLNFIRAIPPEVLKTLPCREQEGNTCCIYSAVTCWEVQNMRPWPHDITQTEDFNSSIEYGACMQDQLYRVWGKMSKTNSSISKLSLRGGVKKTRASIRLNMTKEEYKEFERGFPSAFQTLYPRTSSSSSSSSTSSAVANVQKIVQQLRRGPVYIGLEECGYPWAWSNWGRKSKMKGWAKEWATLPIFDPHANPYEKTKRAGSDTHAMCIVGMFYSTDVYLQTVKHGFPKREAGTPIGNVFVVKCTNMPAGWTKRPCPKYMGLRDDLYMTNIAYALLPADMIEGQMNILDRLSSRCINECFAIPTNDSAGLFFQSPVKKTMIDLIDEEDEEDDDDVVVVNMKKQEYDDNDFKNDDQPKKRRRKRRSRTKTKQKTSKFCELVLSTDDDSDDSLWEELF